MLEDLLMNGDGRMKIVMCGICLFAILQLFIVGIVNNKDYGKDKDSSCV